VTSGTGSAGAAQRRLVDYFFVCGLSTALEPYDGSGAPNASLTFKGETLQRYPPTDHVGAAPLPPHVWMVRSPLLRAAACRMRAC